MKRSITFVVAALAASVLAGCSAGLDASTAQQVAPVPGVNTTVPGPEGEGTVAIRNAMLAYPGVEGYKSGDEATLEIWLFNDTRRELTVVITSDSGRVNVDGPITIAPNSYSKPDVKIALTRDLPTYVDLPVDIEIVGVDRFALEIPMAPPNAPSSPYKLEYSEPAGGSH